MVWGDAVAGIFDLELDNLESGGFWILDFRFWILVSPVPLLGGVRGGWILDFRFWILAGPVPLLGGVRGGWILDFRFWILAGPVPLLGGARGGFFCFLPSAFCLGNDTEGDGAVVGEFDGVAQ